MCEQGLVLTVIYNFLSIKYSYKVVRSVGSVRMLNKFLTNIGGEGK